MDVTVIVATFGDPAWKVKAKTAIASAVGQAHVICHHGQSLAEARNEAASLAQTEWLIFLDADDELAPDYVEVMSKATGDLRAPRLKEVEGNRTRYVDLERRDIEQINPCVIGTAIRKSMFDMCGGFPNFPAWEDWALFLRATRLGATLEHVPTDYIAHVRKGSRNHSVDNPRLLHAEIRAWA